MHNKDANMLVYSRGNEKVIAISRRTDSLVSTDSTE